MNISFYSHDIYGNTYNAEKRRQEGLRSPLMPLSSQIQKKESIPRTVMTALETKNQSIKDYQEMRRKVRELHSNSVQEGVNASDPKSLIDQTLASDEEDEEKTEKPVNYNYKEVSNKIQRAKTSVSAGQAFLTARRKTLEIRRKIAAKEGDPEELQLALNHARSMELVAGKKKRHLELEEMAERTRQHDEVQEKTEETAERLKSTLIGTEEEKITGKEEEILETRQETMDKAAKEIRESGVVPVDDMLSELNRMLADMGEEELEQLEDAMELMENMEFMDPHMSKDEIKDLKIKHRTLESKSMVKADMDYLKGMIKNIMPSIDLKV